MKDFHYSSAISIAYSGSAHWVVECCDSVFQTIDHDVRVPASASVISFWIVELSHSMFFGVVISCSLVLVVSVSGGQFVVAESV